MLYTCCCSHYSLWGLVVVVFSLKLLVWWFCFWHWWECSLVACILSAKFLHVIPSSTLEPECLSGASIFQENSSLSFSLRIDQKLLWCTLHFCCMHTYCFLFCFLFLLWARFWVEKLNLWFKQFFSSFFLFSFSVLKTATLLWFVVTCVGQCSDEKNMLQTFSSVQDGICMLRKAHICAQLRLLDVFPASPLEQFQHSSSWRWPCLVLPRIIIERFLFLSLSLPGSWWYGVLGFVPTSSASDSSTLQIIRYASQLWWLLCMTRAVHPQEFLKVDVKHWHVPVWASHSVFHFL